MLQVPTTFICPKQLLELPAYRQANQCTRDKMIVVCTLLCVARGLKGEFVQIPSGCFSRFLSLKGFRQIRESLSSLIECDGEFSYRRSNHRKALGYRFAPQISAADFVPAPLQTKRGRKLSEHRGKQRAPKLLVSGNLLPVHEKLATCLPMFTIDSSRLPEVLDSLPLVKQVIAHCNAENCKAGCRFFSVASTGRVYSSGSNLKTEVREILQVKGDQKL